MTGQQIFNMLVEFFEEDGWDFQWTAGLSVLELRFEGDHGTWRCFAQAREVQDQFVFYSLLPYQIPPEKRQTAAEFITRANYGLISGNFEMDFDDGEIRFKTSIDVEGATLNTPLIYQVVYANLVMTDHYLPGFERLLNTDETPLTILQAIEGDLSADDEV